MESLYDEDANENSIVFNCELKKEFEKEESHYSK